MKLKTRSGAGFKISRRRPMPAPTRPPLATEGRPTLTIFTILRNTDRIKYPWRESIASALPVADEVLVCECGSDDGTAQALDEIASREPRIRVVHDGWGDSFHVLSRLANMLIRESRSDWHFYLNADEVLHERSYAELRRAIADPALEVLAARYTHFCGDFRHTWPFMYERAARIARKSLGVGYDGDACELARPRHRATPVEVDVYHYGKVHMGREREAAGKEFEFQQLYRSIGGFPDPRIVEAYKAGRIDYLAVLKREREQGLIKPFTGRHPAAMLPWVRAIESAYGLAPRPEDL